MASSKEIKTALSRGEVLLHLPTGNRYTPLKMIKVRLSDGWQEALLYRNDKSEEFARPLNAFDNFDISSERG
jgi:hypothetical protein